MKIPIVIQLAVLTVAMTGFYMMVGQAVPQKEVHPPEVIEIAADVTTAEMVEIGKGIFEGKGICATCHKIGKLGAVAPRFPDLAGVATRAATRKPGYSALDYIAESLYEPDTFVVEGFNPGMPEINKPPIGLTDPEIMSVIAFLQTLGGEATVTMETKLVYTGGSLSSAAAAPEEAAVDEATGDDAYGGALAAYGCGTCHDAEATVDPKAPSLAGIGSRLDADSILLELYKHEGDDGLDQVTVSELHTLVETLSAL